MKTSESYRCTVAHSAPTFPAMRSLVLLVALAFAPVLRAQVSFTPAASSHEKRLQRELNNLIQQSTPYLAPDDYQQWWSQVDSVCGCEPLVQLEQLQWRKMFSTVTSERGAFWGTINVMFIHDADIYSAKVIRHEMLHAMLNGDPDHRHPAWKKL